MSTTDRLWQASSRAARSSARMSGTPPCGSNFVGVWLGVSETTGRGRGGGWLRDEERRERSGDKDMADTAEESSSHQRTHVNALLCSTVGSEWPRPVSCVHEHGYARANTTHPRVGSQSEHLVRAQREERQNSKSLREDKLPRRRVRSALLAVGEEHV